MEYDDFHIVLPSNSREGNTPAKYLTCYERAIQLDTSHEWEVGLREVSFKNTIKTIHEDSAYVEVLDVDLKATQRKRFFVFKGLKKIKCNPDQSGWVSPMNRKLTDWYGVYLYDTPHLRKSTEETETQEIEITPARSQEVEDDDDDSVLISGVSGDKTFSFYLSEGYFHLRNESEHSISLTIPLMMATCMGFVENKVKRIGSYISAKESHTFDTLPRGYELKAPHTPMLLQADDNKTYMLVTAQKMRIQMVYTCIFESLTSSTFPAEVTPKPGTYTDPKELETELNKDSKFASFFKFSYDQRLNRFDIITVTPKAGVILHFKNGLHDILGFTTTYIKANRSQAQKGQLEVNLLRGISSLFVYCDLVQPIHVGSIMAPLLRTVSFNVKQYGEMINAHYTNPIYLPINKSMIDSVDIRICDVIGQLIPFAEGVTTMILHFRPA